MPGRSVSVDEPQPDIRAADGSQMSWHDSCPDRLALTAGRDLPLSSNREKRARGSAFLGKASIAAGRDLAYIVVHGDAALDVIGGISSK